MFGFPWNLIIAGIGFLVISGAVIGVVHTHDVKVRTAALAPWKPLTDKCEATKLNAAACAGQWTLAVDSNVSLQNDVNGPEGWAEKVRRCNARAATLETEKSKALARADEAEKQARPRRQRAQTGIQEQTARMEVKPTGATCEQILSNVGANLIKVGKDQLLDAEPAKALDTIKIK